MKKILFVLFILCFYSLHLLAQQQDSIVKVRLQEYFTQYTACYVKPQLVSFNIDYNNHQISINASEAFAYQAFRQEVVDKVYSDIKAILPGPVRFFNTSIITDGKPIEQLIPNYYRKKIKKDNDRLETGLSYNGNPWVKNISMPYDISKGLQNRHIGLWQSHGKYYASAQNGWLWQRPRLFCTTEDMFSQSFVLPYLIPMLEHAGAVVFTPRERDTQHNEVIVDNDPNNQTSRFREKGTSHDDWQDAEGSGFANKQLYYENGQNPFSMGKARCIQANNKGKAYTEWIPDIPEAGQYAVYVSYKSVPQSISDAHYTVYHKGEATEFMVNQQMGGGTWVYLGTFDFDRGLLSYDKVTLTNESGEVGIVTADAVRFGGGMGNIVRGGATSGLPRYLEGARYYAQWAGMPETVYNGRKGSNDYADDINTRSLMVNYLSGGSIYNPDKEGEHIPFELEMAFHTDAGIAPENDFVGSLGIYTTDFNDGKLNSGTSRYASRDLCDIVLSEIKKDVDGQFGINWQRRAMWNRNYSESRLPAVPSSIIEMLSHQNFGDMRLAHDPHFKFTLSRAIYKGILRFIATQHKVDYEIQPLPVSHFAIQFGKKKNTLVLTWQGERDPLEPTATPRSYAVYQRINSASFDNGTVVNKNSYTVKVEPGQIYSFYVTALNRGGASFPSETLSAMRQKKDKKCVLIVNAFDRLSPPYIVNTPDSLGFDINKDPGVAYRSNISLCGKQIGFNRLQAGREGVGSLGYSTSEMEGRVVAGNTFDYPFIHGQSIQAAGKWSFVSCSKDAFEEYIREGEKLISPEEIGYLEAYQCIDIIMGLQKEDKYVIHPYKTFDERLKGIIHSYCLAGGNIFISGSYVGSDMNKSQADRSFCSDILKYSLDSPLNDNEESSIFSGNGIQSSFVRQMNDKFYAVTSPDVLLPRGSALPMLRYNNGRGAAATFYGGDDYRACVMGFPFESISDNAARDKLMNLLLRAFEVKH